MPCRRGEAFPGVVRVRHRRDYLKVRDQGRKRHTRHFLVIVLQKSYGPTRLGLTVSRKVGGAVQRNLVKRRLREFFRLHLEEFVADADISIIAKAGAAQLDYAQICAELAFLRRRSS